MRFNFFILGLILIVKAMDPLGNKGVEHIAIAPNVDRTDGLLVGEHKAIPSKSISKIDALDTLRLKRGFQFPGIFNPADILQLKSTLAEIPKYFGYKLTESDDGNHVISFAGSKFVLKKSTGDGKPVFFSTEKPSPGLTIRKWNGSYCGEMIAIIRDTEEILYSIDILMSVEKPSWNSMRGIMNRKGYCAHSKKEVTTSSISEINTDDSSTILKIADHGDRLDAWVSYCLGLASQGGDTLKQKLVPYMVLVTQLSGAK